MKTMYIDKKEGYDNWIVTRVEEDDLKEVKIINILMNEDILEEKDYVTGIIKNIIRIDLDKKEMYIIDDPEVLKYEKFQFKMILNNIEDLKKTMPWEEKPQCEGGISYYSIDSLSSNDNANKVYIWEEEDERYYDKYYQQVLCCDGKVMSKDKTKINEESFKMIVGEDKLYELVVK